MKKIIAIVLMLCLMIPTCFAAVNSSIEKNTSKLTSFQKKVITELEICNDSSFFNDKFVYYKTDDCATPQRKLIEIMPIITNNSSKIIISIEDEGISYEYETTDLAAALVACTTIVDEWNTNNKNDYCIIRYVDMTYRKNNIRFSVVGSHENSGNYKHIMKVTNTFNYVFCSMDNFMDVILEYSNSITINKLNEDLEKYGLK